jgi:spore coat polysaccharide biosynthesis protein SpsF
MNTLGIVEVCQDSSNARTQVSRRLGGQSLLERVVRRVTDCERLGRVIVVASEDADDAFISSLVPPDVPLFVGSQSDMLSRYVAALEEYPADAVVRVSSDNPFVDPMYIDRLVTTAHENPQCDYIGYCTRNGRPAVLSSLGIFAEWCRADALRTAHRKTTSTSDCAQPTQYVYSHSEEFDLRFIPIPQELEQNDLRLKIDLEEDWEHAQTIYEALGPEDLDWRRIAGLLGRQAALRERMAVLNRSTAAV